MVDAGTCEAGCGAVVVAAVRGGTDSDGAVREAEVCVRPAESRDDDNGEARTNMGTLLEGTAPVGAVVWGHNRSRTCESDSDVWGERPKNESGPAEWEGFPTRRATPPHSWGAMANCHAPRRYARFLTAN